MPATAEARPPADPMTPRPRRVARRRRETADTVTIELAPDPAAAAFAPGQFSMLYAFGVGEAAISISGRGADGGEAFTIRAVGGVTHALTAMRPGDALGARGPFGVGWPVAAQAGRRLVFVSGGLGLAPLAPAIRAALARRERYAGLTLVHGARAPADLLFTEELAAWRRRGLEIAVTVDRAPRDWTGRVGVVTLPLAEALARPPDAPLCAFVCGPEVMMRFAARELLRAGAAPDRVFLSLERHMKCALGHCGRCQLGPEFVCRDGPVLPFSRLAALLPVREL